MQHLLFLVIALSAYFVSDFLLQALEVRIGRRLEHRTLVFFALLLGLTMTAFAIVRHWLPS